MILLDQIFLAEIEDQGLDDGATWIIVLAAELLKNALTID
jgi:hypothetical protein